MKIVITNAVTLNGGDAAILQGILRTLARRWPSASVTVFDSQAEVAQRLYPQLRYLPLAKGTLPARRLLLAASLFRRGLRRSASLLCNAAEYLAIEALCEADLVISTGGTYLVEVYDIRHRILQLRLAAACGQPVVFFTQSLGPFRKASSREGLRPAFDASPVVLLRDERSRAHLLELGVDGDKLHVVPDAAFALAHIADRQGPPTAPLRVAISVRRWSHFRESSEEQGMARYRQAIAGLIRHIVQQWDASVELVSTCQGVPEYWADDSATAQRIADELEADLAAHVQVNAAFHTPDELRERLAHKDIVVATRMHAGILALCAGTPVLPIAYEFKTDELFNQLGMGELVTHVDDISAEMLIDRFDRLLGALPAMQDELFSHVGRLRTEALAVAKLLPAINTLAAIAGEVRKQKLTYLSDQKLLNIQRCLEDLQRDDIAGDCLEAGVALGGSAIVICTLMGDERRFVGYDVFGMIPPPGDRDDEKSHRRYATIKTGGSAGIGGDDYYGYRDDLYRDVVAAFAVNGLQVDGSRIALERGLFEDTMQLDGRRIALAHIDCDWYEPVALCLERIYGALVPGGFVVSDDYHDYGGCRAAVDEFVASKADMRIVSREGNLVMRRDGA